MNLILSLAIQQSINTIQPKLQPKIELNIMRILMYRKLEMIQ